LNSQPLNGNKFGRSRRHGELFLILNDHELGARVEEQNV